MRDKEGLAYTREVAREVEKIVTLLKTTNASLVQQADHPILKHKKRSRSHGKSPRKQPSINADERAPLGFEHGTITIIDDPTNNEDTSNAEEEDTIKGREEQDEKDEEQVEGTLIEEATHQSVDAERFRTFDLSDAVRGLQQLQENSESNGGTEELSASVYRSSFGYEFILFYCETHSSLFSISENLSNEQYLEQLKMLLTESD